MLCTSCGARMLHQAKFCWNCGQPQKPPVRIRMPRWETCEILVSDGIDGECGMLWYHHFWARATGLQGDYCAGRSAGFYRPDWEPQPEHAARQHEALVWQLLKEGWEPTGECGRKWWVARFRRGIRATPPAADERVPVTGPALPVHPGYGRA
jgi:hypothetical protein